MATVVKSDIVTNSEATTLVERGLIAGPLKVTSAHVATGAALTDNSILPFFKIHVDANISSLRFASDDLGTTGDINIGFYPGTIAAASLLEANAVDEDALASAIDVNAAAVALTEIRYQVKAIETVQKKAWELAGLSARPVYDTFWVAGTLSEATTAAGDVILVCHHT